MTESEELGRLRRVLRRGRRRPGRRRRRRAVVIVAPRAAPVVTVANPYMRMSTADLQAVLATPGATPDAKAQASAALSARGISSEGQPVAPTSSAHAWLTRHTAPGTEYSQLPTGPGERWSTTPGGPRGALIPHTRFSQTATMGADLLLVGALIFPGVRASAEKGLAAQMRVDALRVELLTAAPNVGITAIQLAQAPGIYEGWSGGPAGAGVLITSTPSGDPIQEVDTFAASILFYSRAGAPKARAIITTRVAPNGDRGTWVEFVDPGPGPMQLRTWWKSHAGSLMREGFAPGEARIVSKMPTGKVKSDKVQLDPPEGTERLTRPITSPAQAPAASVSPATAPPSAAVVAHPATPPGVAVAAPAPQAVRITRVTETTEPITAADIQIGPPGGGTPAGMRVEGARAGRRARKGAGIARLIRAEQQLARQGRVNPQLFAQIQQDTQRVCQRLRGQLPARKRNRLMRALSRLEAVLRGGVRGRSRGLRGDDSDDPDDFGEDEHAVEDFGQRLPFIAGKRKRIRRAEKQLARGKVKPKLLQRIQQDRTKIAQKLQRVRKRRRRGKLLDLLERIDAVIRGDRSMEGVLAGMEANDRADAAELENAEMELDAVDEEIEEVEGAIRAARRARRGNQFGAVDFGAHKKAKAAIRRARENLGSSLDRLKERADKLKAKIQTLEDKEIKGPFRRMKERSRDKRVERYQAKLEPIEERIEEAEEKAAEAAAEAKEKEQAAAQEKALEEYERTLEGAGGRRSFARPDLLGRRQFWGIV